MDIPGEVLDEVKTLDYDKQHQVIAEWARKETLREAADAIVNTDPQPDIVTWNNVGGWTLGRAAALATIRALDDAPTVASVTPRRNDYFES